MNDLPIEFLPDSINDNLAAAQRLTDDIVPTAMRLIQERAKELALTGDTIQDACMDAAAAVYEHAIHTLRALKGTERSSNYGAYSRAVLMRIAVADSLTHRAGWNFSIANALGHLASPLGDHPGLREAVAQNKDLHDRMRLATESAGSIE